MQLIIFIFESGLLINLFWY